MTDLTVVSFYTPNDGWPEKADQLAADCAALDVSVFIEVCRDAGGWLANCRHKPAGGPVLWLDADTRLLAAPAGLDPSLDFMGRAKPPGQNRIWHVDAMYFSGSDASRELVRLWIEWLTDHSDEHAFNELWKAGVWSGNWGALPPSYDGGPESIVRYGRSRSERKSREMAALRARGR